LREIELTIQALTNTVNDSLMYLHFDFVFLRTSEHEQTLPISSADGKPGKLESRTGLLLSVRGEVSHQEREQQRRT
jgi:hypothetical protein